MHTFCYGLVRKGVKYIYKNKYIAKEFEFVKDKSMSILVLKACLELNFISRLYNINLNSRTATSEVILDSYSDVFEFVQGKA